MELQFLGGASEVGSLGLVVRDQGRTLLFDYGLTPSDPPTYPRPFPSNVDAALISHSHLDHTGMSPLLSRLGKARIAGTAVTSEITDLLARDNLKIARLERYLPPYTHEDILALEGRFLPIERRGTFRHHGIEVNFTPAGHIPGASMFLYRGAEDLLFTGDILRNSTHLVPPAEMLGCDVMVMESTYAGKEHPDRAQTEKQFRAKVTETVERGGQAIIPAFAVGRAQEVLLALEATGLDVWLDGMARKVNSIYLRHPEYLANGKRFRRAVEAVSTVDSPERRRHAVKNAQVVVTTGGMLDGGPVLSYIGDRYKDPKSSILLTGFQVDGSNGRQLMDQGTLTIDGVTIRPECEVLKFDFSAHAGHSDLVQMVRDSHAKKVVLMHGDHREALADAIRGEVEVLLPENGHRFEV
ncbi:MAG: MBL fold metallo-hydrolase [Thermoplasmata archaeon]|nr:MBL fold metallo-hydrolase [Thermoplasmata archaeon]